LIPLPVPSYADWTAEWRGNDMPKLHTVFLIFIAAGANGQT
jgi:hypothetical protein